MAFRVVIAGAGVAALETALALRALAEDVVSVELVAPEEEFTYRPLAVAEPFRVGEVRRFPLAKLVAATGAELRRGAVAQVDLLKTLRSSRTTTRSPSTPSCLPWAPSRAKPPPVR